MLVEICSEKETLVHPTVVFAAGCWHPIDHGPEIGVRVFSAKSGCCLRTGKEESHFCAGLFCEVIHAPFGPGCWARRLGDRVLRFAPFFGIFIDAGVRNENRVS